MAWRVKLHTGGWENGRMATTVPRPDHVDPLGCSVLTWVVIDDSDGVPRAYGKVEWIEPMISMK